MSDELIGAELDAAVARLEGWRPVDWTAALTTWTNGQRLEILGGLDFSQDWALGGPIIERERISLEHAHNRGEPDWEGCGNGDSAVAGDVWEAYAANGSNGEFAYGPTALIAAMRAFVASKA